MRTKLDPMNPAAPVTRMVRISIRPLINACLAGAVGPDDFEAVAKRVAHVEAVEARELGLLDQLESRGGEPAAELADVGHLVRQVRTGCGAVDAVFEPDVQRAIADFEPDQVVAA